MSAHSSDTPVYTSMGYMKSIMAVLLPISVFVIITLVLSSNNVNGGTIAALWVYFLIPCLFVTFRLFANKPVFSMSTSEEASQHVSDYEIGEEDGWIVQNNEEILKHHQSPVKGFIKVFWILLIITLAEIGIAYTSMPISLMASIFVLLTFVKAFYIAGNFMHLKDEAKGFIYTLVLPVLFLFWLIFITMNESSYLFIHRLFW